MEEQEDFAEEEGSHFTPEYIKGKLENIRTLFMTEGLKDKSALKAAAKKPGFTKNSEAYNEFFAGDGGKEYREMAKAMNDCIKLLGAPAGDDWSEKVIDAFRRVKAAANTYRKTHKSVLRVVGVSSHVTKVGDARVNIAMQLMYESSVYENMMSSYIANGSKDSTTIKDSDREDETERLNNVMTLRNKYIKKLFSKKLALSKTSKQTMIAWAGDDSFISDENGNYTGLPSDPVRKTAYFVAVNKMRELMKGDITADQIMSMEKEDLDDNGFNRDVEKIVKDPKYAAAFKKSKSGKKQSDAELQMQIMNMNGNNLLNNTMMSRDLNTSRMSDKMTDFE